MHLWCTQQFKWSGKNIFHLNFKIPLPLIVLAQSVPHFAATRFVFLLAYKIIVAPPSLSPSSASVGSVDAVHTTTVVFRRQGKYIFWSCAFVSVWRPTDYIIRMHYTDWVIHITHTYYIIRMCYTDYLIRITHTDYVIPIFFKIINKYFFYFLK